MNENTNPGGGIDAVKPEKKEETAVSGTISLVLFKVTNNLKELEYAGFKRFLNANDEDSFNSADLQTKLENYRSQGAFNQNKGR
jgi:hypothetical protein